MNQLYPILISLAYGNGDVGASLASAHRLNAFLMASAAIPVYLLARYAGAGRLVSLWAGALAVAVPWIVLASFLLTESVAYPAFCWALLAITYATARRSNLADALAVAAIAVAFLSRTQLVILGAAFVLVVAADALLEAASAGRRGGAMVRSAAESIWKARKLLLGVTLAGFVVVLVFAVRGETSRLLGSYAVTTKGVRLDFDVLQLAAEHLAILALGTAILPFLLATGWLVSRLRSDTPVRDRSLALVGCTTLVLLTLQVASFDQRFGEGLVKDRYLFYALPVVLMGLVAALRSSRWPRWALLVPTAVCVAGFASVTLPRYTKLNVDSPLAILNDELMRLATSLTWARVLLVLATILAAVLLLEAAVFLPRRVVAVAVAVLLTVALPAEAVYAFDRLFRVDGTNGLPVTLDQRTVFGWIDRTVGKDGRVTMLRYPAADQDYWAGVAYWWDAEFWNESVVDDEPAGRAVPGPRALDERVRLQDRGDDRPEGHAVRARLRQRRPLPAGGPPGALRARRVHRRARAALACRLRHDRHLRRRLDETPHARRNPGVRQARPADAAAALPHVRARLSRPDRGQAGDDLLEPRPLRDDAPAAGLARPPNDGVRPARWVGDRADRDADRLDHLPGPVAGAADRRGRPADRRPPPLDRARGRDGADVGVPRRAAGAVRTQPRSGAAASPAQALGVTLQARAKS